MTSRLTSDDFIPWVPIVIPSEIGDGVELHRRAARRADAFLDVLGEAAQVEVAGHRLGPGVGDADRRPAEVVVVEADALHVGAGGGAVGPVEDGCRSAVAAGRNE